MLRIESYETLRSILDSHAYPVTGPDGAEKRIPLRLTREETGRAKLLQPAELEGFLQGLIVPPATEAQRLCVGFDEETTTTHLWSMRQRNQLEPGVKPETLVLNFASGLRPGGDVATGGRGQEESLCMASTLLNSLESEAAKAFYAAQQAAAQDGGLGADEMLLSPMVEFFAADGVPLNRTRVAAVLSAVAPDGCAHGAQEKLKHRIRCVLYAAARLGYRRLILGAWGCGRQGHDPEAVAQAFEAALRERVRVRQPDGSTAEAGWQDYFDSVCFAVPGGGAAEAFRQHFSHFHRKELDQMKEKFLQKIEERRRRWLPAIRGSLLGGAIGDALGYAVEFLSLGSIRQKYGEGGIRQYERSPRTGLAVISDDTQMTLFTAAGLLNYETDRFVRDEDLGPEGYVFKAYRDWFVTQQAGVNTSGAEWLKDGWKTATWIGREPRLFARRAPGNTCLSALQYGDYCTPDDPINQSKGCGGVMRVAPVGLFHRGEQTRQQLMDLGWEAANMAALTHGHPLGYIPAAGLAMMVNRAAYGGCPCDGGLYGIVQECTELLNEMFEDRCGIEQMTDLLQDAAELSRSDLPDAMCIARLGEGWVGEEALAIAVFCCLRYQDDFSKAVIAAVNHGGDSDSTGAVAGNLLGAWLGADAIDPCWLDDLELLDMMEELARDLCDGCRADLSIGYTDAEWMRKYARNGGFWASGMGDDA
ncbi:MAG: TIGR02452 family protein [Clostridia bacterium]|nr:TIGR02452 family protein [Clostridia bacterium]